MGNSYKLSIVVPFYNIPDSLFLPFLESIENQDSDDFELIIVDDGSTNPESLASLEKVRQRIPNASVFHKPNGGLSSARNFGLEHISGNLLWIIDPDDYIPEKCAVSKILNEFKADDDIAVLIFGYCEKQDSGKILDKRVCKERVSFDGKEAFRSLSIGCSIMTGYTWSKVFNLAVIGKDRLGRFNQNITLYEDKLWQLGFLNTVDKCLYIPDILYQYNFNPKSLSHTISEERAYSAYTDYILPFLAEQKGKDSDEYQGAGAFIYRRCWYETFGWVGQCKKYRNMHLNWLTRLRTIVNQNEWRKMPKDIIYLKMAEPFLHLILKIGRAQ